MRKWLWLLILLFECFSAFSYSTIEIKQLQNESLKQMTINLDSANSLLEISIAKCKVENNKLQLCYGYLIKSLIYFSKGEYQVALGTGQEGIELAKEIKSDTLLARFGIMVADIFIIQKDFINATQYLNLTKSVLPRFKNNQIYGSYYYTLSSLYMDAGDTLKLNETLKKALEYNTLDGYHSGVSNVYNQMGLILLNNDKYKLAKGKFMLAESYALKNNNYKALAKVYNNLGICYWNLNKLDSAEYFFKQAIATSKLVGLKNTLPPSYLNLSGVYEEQGNYKAALQMHQKFYSLNDSIFSIEKVRLLKSVEEKYETEKKEAEIKSLQTQRNFTIASIILALFVAAFVFRQNGIVKAQKKEVEFQKQIVELKNKETTDSINYALRLQKAILPQTSQIKKHCPNHFIYYQPKDIVAGDFYWFHPIANSKSNYLIAAADCTGHGVPGAMVSVVCANALNRTVKEMYETEPGKILDNAANLIIETFEKSESEVKDGMDISICNIDTANLKLLWAGAHNNLIIVRNNELFELKCNKQPVATFENRKPFTTQYFNLQKNDCIYLFTDGYIDQFGGKENKKLMKKRFQQLLLDIYNLDCNAQQQSITQYMQNWKGNEEQVDDMCIIGIKI